MQVRDATSAFSTLAVVHFFQSTGKRMATAAIQRQRRGNVIVAIFSGFPLLMPPTLSESEPRVHRFAFKCQYPEHAFMHPPQWFPRNKPLQSFHSESEFPKG